MEREPKAARRRDAALRLPADDRRRGGGGVCPTARRAGAAARRRDEMHGFEALSDARDEVWRLRLLVRMSWRRARCPKEVMIVTLAELRYFHSLVVVISLSLSLSLFERVNAQHVCAGGGGSRRPG